MNDSGPPALGRQLAMAAKATRAEFDARLGEVGGSLTAFLVLRLADEAPGGLELSQRQLAERMGVEAPTMVRHQGADSNGRLRALDHLDLSVTHGEIFGLL